MNIFAKSDSNTPDKDFSGRLFDTLLNRYKLKNDAALARALDVSPPCISRIRHGKLPLGSSIMLNIHETFGMPVKEIRSLAAG